MHIPKGKNVSNYRGVASSSIFGIVFDLMKVSVGSSVLCFCCDCMFLEAGILLADLFVCFLEALVFLGCKSMK